MTRQSVALAVVVALIATPGGVWAASFDCTARRLTQAEMMICADAQLSRSDDELNRRISRASRQLAYGPYVGLKVWQSDWRQQRADCNTDRTCLASAYLDANRFLDRLQRCLGTSARGRRCLPVTVEGKRSAIRRP